MAVENAVEATVAMLKLGVPIVPKSTTDCPYKVNIAVRSDDGATATIESETVGIRVVCANPAIMAMVLKMLDHTFKCDTSQIPDCPVCGRAFRRVLTQTGGLQCDGCKAVYYP